MDIIPNPISSVKSTFGIVILTVVGMSLMATASASYFLYQKYQSQREEIVTLETENTSLKAEIKLKDTVAQVLTLAQLLSEGEKEELEAAIKKAKDELRQKEARIRKEITDPILQAKALSEARYESVYSAYCQVSMKSDAPDPKCQVGSKP